MDSSLWAMFWVRLMLYLHHKHCAGSNCCGS